VGRGALAGPVVAAAVIFPPTHVPLVGITDSKKLTPKKRAFFSEQIKAQATHYTIAEVAAHLIDRRGIVWATQEAMLQALRELPGVHQALVDGLPLGELATTAPCPCEFIVKGDQKSYSIAAASIIAKVHRDTLMETLDLQFPEYGWAVNKGYGTVKHLEALERLGLTTYHRKSFCNSVIAH
jgi:ribonuclease HII